MNESKPVLQPHAPLSEKTSNPVPPQPHAPLTGTFSVDAAAKPVTTPQHPIVKTPPVVKAPVVATGAPTVTAPRPSFSTGGNTFNISGKGFGAAAGKVAIGDTDGKVTNWTDTRIQGEFAATAHSGMPVVITLADGSQLGTEWSI